jgi:carbonic anhydrase/acetyltransferase-like protein (isoleucine patch superfamily)
MVIRSFGDKTPKIHPTAFVSEAAYVVGDVEIGEGSSIWPGTIIRANEYKIKIGKFVNIQDNSVIHSDADCSYGDHVTIGHHVMCHATTVEEHCLIGNGATVNGYTTIGHHSIIASGSVVLERVEIAPNSFVTGAPAEVRRQITERHIQLLNKYSADYYHHGQEFKEAGLQDPDQEKFTDPNV